MLKKQVNKQGRQLLTQRIQSHICLLCWQVRTISTAGPIQLWKSQLESILPRASSSTTQLPGDLWLQNLIIGDVRDRQKEARPPLSAPQVLSGMCSPDGENTKWGKTNSDMETNERNQ